MTARKPSATIGLKVRMKEPLRAMIAKAAEKRGVSLNAETVRRLEDSFRAAAQAGEIAARGAVDKLQSWAIVEIARILMEQIASPGGERIAFEELGVVVDKIEKAVLKDEGVER